MDNIKRELAMFANIVKQALPSKSSGEGPSTQPIATALLAPIQVASFTVIPQKLKENDTSSKSHT
jgi:hypothetical protein